MELILRSGYVNAVLSVRGHVLREVKITAVLAVVNTAQTNTRFLLPGLIQLQILFHCDLIGYSAMVTNFAFFNAPPVAVTI
jgi:hypothetical protein